MGELGNLLKSIEPIDETMCQAAREKWDQVGKPLRSLGRLEDMVIQLAGITRELNPKADKKAVLIFCADNGVVEEGVTQTGSQVTAIVTENFTKEPVVDYATAKTADTKAFATYFKQMFDKGNYFGPSQFEAIFLSAAHTRKELDKTLADMKEVLGAI